METRYLETLVSAAETGSFSRTAELLHITQSAVSQRVKFLEESLGQQLIDRSSSRLRPTEAGQVVLEKSREILALERQMREQLKRLGAGKRLSICCTPTFGMAFLPQVLNDFMRRNADLEDFKFIFQQPEAALHGLQDRTFDIAIIEHCDDLDLTGLQTIDLLKDELVFVSAPQLGLPPGTVSLNTLLACRLYARRDGCSSKELLKRNLGMVNKTIDDFAGVIVSDDLRLTLQEVAAGRGISFVSRALAEEMIARGELVAHLVEGFIHVRCRSLVVSRQVAEELVVRDFIDSVRRVFGDERLC